MSGPTGGQIRRFDVIPSIDLRRGRVVRLLEGRDDRATVYVTDPAELLRRFAAGGARLVHVVDLDAAFGGAQQTALLERLVRSVRETKDTLVQDRDQDQDQDGKTFHLGGGGRGAGGEDGAVAVGATPEASQPGGASRPSRLHLQLGGGLRDAAAIERALAAGFDRVVVGSMVVRDFDSFAAVVQANPDRIVPALDCRDAEVHHGGWRDASSLLWKSLSLKLRGLPCPAVLVTDIARDGSLAGANVELAAGVGEASGIPALVSGGVASVEDVARAACAGFAGAGVGGVILGRALHEGRITVESALAAVELERAGRVAR